jgi:DNA primase
MRIGRREVRLTNLDKAYFPERGLTKGDLVSYYVDVADCVLHHVRRRPMQMKRYPDGVDGFFFYQKRVPEPHPDWLDTVRIDFPSGRHAYFPVVADAAGLAWIANLGCIELHTWHSRIDDVERPDYLLIDPDRGQPLVARPGGRDGRQGGDGRARAGPVPEDLGGDRPAHPRADPARAAFCGRA